MLPPPPYGITKASGAAPSSSTISNTAVFWPALRYGLTEFTSTCVPRRPSSCAAASASSKSPRTSSTLAPNIRVWATFGPATAPAGVSTTAGIPARAAYAAADAAVFPVEAQMTASAPSSAAFETATVMPRSLYEPVGFDASHLSRISTPSSSDSRGARSRGVDPSPSEITGVRSETGRLERYLSMSAMVMLPSI